MSLPDYSSYQFPNFNVPGFPFANLYAQLAASMQSPSGGQYQRFGAPQTVLPNSPQSPGSGYVPNMQVPAPPSGPQFPAIPPSAPSTNLGPTVNPAGYSGTPGAVPGITPTNGAVSKAPGNNKIGAANDVFAGGSSTFDEGAAATQWLAQHPGTDYGDYARSLGLQVGQPLSPIPSFASPAAKVASGSGLLSINVNPNAGQIQSTQGLNANTPQGGFYTNVSPDAANRFAFTIPAGYSTNGGLANIAFAPNQSDSSQGNRQMVIMDAQGNVLGTPGAAGQNGIQYFSVGGPAIDRWGNPEQGNYANLNPGQTYYASFSGPGPNSTPGASALDIALRLGNTTNMRDFLNTVHMNDAGHLGEALRRSRAGRAGLMGAPGGMGAAQNPQPGIPPNYSTPSLPVPGITPTNGAVGYGGDLILGPRQLRGQ